MGQGSCSAALAEVYRLFRISGLKVLQVYVELSGF